MILSVVYAVSNVGTFVFCMKQEMNLLKTCLNSVGTIGFCMKQKMNLMKIVIIVFCNFRWRIC